MLTAPLSFDEKRGSDQRSIDTLRLVQKYNPTLQSKHSRRFFRSKGGGAKITTQAKLQNANIT